MTETPIDNDDWPESWYRWYPILQSYGFMTGIPTGTGRPDHPLVLLNSRSLSFMVLCANQCVRDSNHTCGVEVPSVSDLIEQRWIDIVCAKTPWMIIEWGMHRHTLPFCCSKCAVDFIEWRTANFEAARDRSGI
jgi:endogenous inhibitor of DNA gyrase (YacG/DUF329 family)